MILRLLLVGDDVPSSMLRSLRPGLAARANVFLLDPAKWRPRDAIAGYVPRTLRRLRGLGDRRFVEAVAQLEPDAALVVKGWGLTGEGLEAARALGCTVAVYYPDNPLWCRHDESTALGRLLATDVLMVFSKRLARLLHPHARYVTNVPFGFDPHWFPVTPTSADRKGIVFLGTWSPRRQRYLEALRGLPLTVAGTDWNLQSAIPASPPITEERAAAILSGALIGINLLHPQCSGAHNMRTREIAACGAVQLTDPAIDGSPLRDGEHCLWFGSPHELRAKTEWVLDHTQKAIEIAKAGQTVVVEETYAHRARQMLDVIESRM